LELVKRRERGVCWAEVGVLEEELGRIRVEEWVVEFTERINEEKLREMEGMGWCAYHETYYVHTTLLRCQCHDHYLASRPHMA